MLGQIIGQKLGQIGPRIAWLVGNPWAQLGNKAMWEKQLFWAKKLYLSNSIVGKPIFVKLFSENQSFEMFGRIFVVQNSSNNRFKNRDQNSEGGNPAEQGSAEKPSQVLQQIDTDVKATTRRARKFNVSTSNS